MAAHKVKVFTGRVPSTHLSRARGGYRTVRLTEDAYWRIRSLATDSGRTLSGVMIDLLREERVAEAERAA